jgi:hypothetical protein
MNPLTEYAEAYADALARQFATELRVVDAREEIVREDTDATVSVVEATADVSTLAPGVLAGLDVAVRQFATQHGFEFDRAENGGVVTYEMYPSPAIDFPTHAQ